MRRILIALLLAPLLLIDTAAFAQPAPAPPVQTVQTPAPPARVHRTVADRFEEANTTHDGHLTPEQARAKMPAVARNFAAIDSTNKGYVTLDEIRAYAREKRAERRAARQAGQTPAQ